MDTQNDSKYLERLKITIKRLKMTQNNENDNYMKTEKAGETRWTQTYQK